jgi:hypothetical protein
VKGATKWYIPTQRGGDRPLRKQDVVLLAVSFYMLKRDLARLTLAAEIV